MNLKIKNNSGITLIALMVTLAVIIVLLGVSINVFVNSDIIGHSEKTGQAYTNALENDKTIGNDGVTINGKRYANMEDFGRGEELIESNIAGGTRVDENKEYAIKGETRTAVIPAGFTVSGIREETTIDGGLVIYDIPEGTTVDWTTTEKVDMSDENSDTCYTVQKNYNQFVWVPVETPYVTKAELNKIMSDSNGSITTEKAALQSLVDSGKYPMAVELANGTDYRGVLYEFSAGTNKVNIEVMDFSTEANYDDGSVKYYREPAKLSSTDSNKVNQTEEQNLDLQTEYNKIVKSVKAQNGFWVARYELSYNTKGESKRGKTVANSGDSATYKWYGLYNACKTVSIANNKNEMQSSMIYGSQWDQIMIWMKEVKNTEDNSKYYILDSSYMGNYSTSSGGTGEKQVSGYKNAYGVKQIFDLGGNLMDETTEADWTYGRVLRGDRYYGNGSSLPASFRSISGPESAGIISSARVALYVSL